MSEVIGDITYVGADGANVIQVGQPQYQSKETYELDRATVKYDGAPGRVETFVDDLARGAAMSYKDGAGATQTIGTMFLYNAGANDHAFQREAVLSFIGYKTDLPPPEVKDSLATANVSVSVTTTADPPSTLTLNIEYKAARTSYSWYTDAEPDPNLPEYNTVTNTTSPFDEDAHRITKWEIVGGTEGETIALADFIELVSSLTLQTNYENYEISEVIPDELWKCSVMVQSVVVPA